MPSAGPDAARRDRFRTDLKALLDGAGLAVDAPLGIALSGGPDSCALLVLARSGAAGRIAALTVDHGLRVAAAEEAAAAAGLCATLGVAHETTRVTLARPDQAAARTARYEALSDWATRLGVVAILTAHHADDQAETMLMRLSRGSGLAGLSGIRAARRLATGLPVLRPLLGWRKAELETICDEAGIVPARDPSNADARFDRTRARALLANQPWLDAGRLADAAGHLAEAEAALRAVADQRYGVEDDGIDVLLRPDPLREIARRHVTRLLAERFDAHPDGPSLMRMLAVLTAGGTTTCADVICRADPPFWRFRRAPPRRQTAPAS